MGAQCVSRAPPLACALTQARGKPSSRAIRGAWAALLTPRT